MLNYFLYPRKINNLEKSGESLPGFGIDPLEKINKLYENKIFEENLVVWISENHIKFFEENTSFIKTYHFEYKVVKSDKQENEESAPDPRPDEPEDVARPRENSIKNESQKPIMEKSKIEELDFKKMESDIRRNNPQTFTPNETEN
jgi:hypothetical protein